MGRVKQNSLKRHYKKVRQKKSRQGKKEPKSVVIEDVEFLSTDQMKKVVKNPTNAIRASGKRKQKMLKRMRQNVRSSAGMECAVEEVAVSAEVKAAPKSRKSKKSKRKNVKTDKEPVLSDVEMEDSETTT